MPLNTRLATASVYPTRPRMGDPNTTTKSAVSLRQDALEDTATKVVARTEGQVMVTRLSSNEGRSPVINTRPDTNAYTLSPAALSGHI